MMEFCTYGLKYQNRVPILRNPTNLEKFCPLTWPSFACIVTLNVVRLQYAAQFVKSIQYLRGFAILSVVSYHIWILGFFDNLSLFRYGHWGVELFFVISGFIMIQKLSSYRNFLDFTRRRISRLWPSIATTLLLSTPFALLVAGGLNYPEITFPDYFSSFFMINPMILNGIFGTSVNYPYQILWTISVELTFYFAISIVYFLLGRRHLYVVIGILGLSITSVYLNLSDNPFSHIHNLFLAGGVTYFPFFLLGCTAWLGRLPQLKYQLYCLPIAITAIFLAVTSATQIDGEIHPSFVILIIVALFAILTAFDSKPIFSVKILEVIGNYSYEIYLVHGILIFPILEYVYPHFLKELMIGKMAPIREILFLALLLNVVFLFAYCVNRFSRLFKQFI